VGDILAMARAGKSAAGGGPPAAEAPPAPPAAKKSPTVADKPAAAAKASPAAGVKAGKEGASAKAASAAGPRDTASILAAARKKDKPGPMTKSEAAAKETASPAPPARLTAPPMPTKPAYAQQPSVAAKPRTKGEPDVERRNFLWIGFSALGAVSALWSLAVVKFLFPNVLREPPSKFKVGFPDAFPPGKVDERFKAQYGVWIVNAEYNGQPQLVALKTVCTHLGCTPNWLEAEQKYKCPCHGSGFYKDGINFEGPAPRPLERYAIRIADDGQIEVDKSKTFQEEMGQWSDPLSFIMV
jgi:cytochrome b6-f complex iron-sulfur subunit